ncbi:MAG: LysM peptidoglycan-binding domain-containing protein, partial [Syntrophaceae bacterium]|nr:LysM peptidoglycan-binding domain-containing protein [Syntrophaceae bacterium]
MSKTRIMKFAFIVFLFLTSVTFAQTREMNEHKVIKGDTLWDIADAELKNSFLWPKIWKENTWIKNPDKIYPNQIIKIPLYLVKKEKLKEEAGRQDAASYQEPAIIETDKKAATLKKQPLVDENTLMASGYIADTIPGGGKIGESSSGQPFFGNGDIVSIKLDHSVQIKDKFYVIKTSKLLKHPVTGARIGYVVSIGGIAEIVKAKDGETMAVITKCFREIGKGELLVPYYEMELPLTTGQFRRPNINGMIVAAGNDWPYQSMLDIIYIDKGYKDGIKTGDMFRTIAVDNDQPLPN